MAGSTVRPDISSPVVRAVTPPGGPAVRPGASPTVPLAERTAPTNEPLFSTIDGVAIDDWRNKAAGTVI